MDPVTLAAAKRYTRSKVGGLRVADIQEPFVIAHRGGALVYPENTMEAYRGIIEAGIPLIEQDVYRLRDGALAVMHDSTVNRTTSSTGPVVDHTSMSWQQLEVNADEWFGGGWGKLKAPFLGEVLEAFARSSIFVIESKTREAAKPIVDMVLEYGLKDSVIFQSFNYNDCAYALAAGIPTMFLSNSANPDQLVADGVQFVGHSRSASPEYVASLAEKGLKPVVYTINRRSEWEMWQSRGDVGCFSDDPVYISGIGPKLTADPFALGTYFHGHIPSRSSQKGRFDNGRWGFPTTSTNDFVLQGWGAPISGDSFTIELTIDYENTSGTSTDWASIFVGCPTDKLFNDADSGDGYHALLRLNGKLDLYKVTGSTAVLIDGAQTPQITPQDNQATLKVEVTPATITVTRTGIDPEISVSTDDTTYRGGYFHLGHRRIPVMFSNVTISS